MANSKSAKYFLANMENLETADISKISNVIDISYGFLNDTNLTSINWGNIQPNTFNDTFKGASAKKTITVAKETADWLTNNSNTMGLDSNREISFKHTFTMVYNYEGSSEVLAMQVEEGAPLDYSIQPNRDKYKFTRWTSDIEGMVEAPMIMGTEDITVYAQWEADSLTRFLKYDELSYEIPLLTPGIYDLTIDCKNVSPNIFKGVLNLETQEIHQSEISQKLALDWAGEYLPGFTGLTKDGVGYNLKFTNFPDNVIDATLAFAFCPILSIDTSNFTQVTNANYMLYYCVYLTSIDTKAFTQVTNAEGMFVECSKLTSIDASGFTQVTNASYMFQNCKGLAEINWGNIKPVKYADMFGGSDLPKKITIADQETADWINANASNMSLVNYYYDKKPIDLNLKYNELSTEISNLAPHTIYNLTVDCSEIDNASLKEFGNKLSGDSYFNLKPINIDPSITDAVGMFSNCKELTSIDTSAFTQVTNANHMFYGCSGLTSIDTSAFTQVTNANHMFSNCKELTSIDTSAFTQVTNASEMFGGCTNLVEINWGNIKPANNFSMFNGALAAKVIKVTDQEAADWINTNASNMSLTNYTVEIAV